MVKDADGGVDCANVAYITSPYSYTDGLIFPTQRLTDKEIKRVIPIVVEGLESVVLARFHTKQALRNSVNVAKQRLDWFYEHAGQDGSSIGSSDLQLLERELLNVVIALAEFTDPDATQFTESYAVLENSFMDLCRNLGYIRARLESKGQQPQPENYSLFPGTCPRNALSAVVNSLIAISESCKDIRVRRAIAQRAAIVAALTGILDSTRSAEDKKVVTDILVTRLDNALTFIDCLIIDNLINNHDTAENLELLRQGILYPAQQLAKQLLTQNAAKASYTLEFRIDLSMLNLLQATGATIAMAELLKTECSDVPRSSLRALETNVYAALEDLSELKEAFDTAFENLENHGIEALKTNAEQLMTKEEFINFSHEIMSILDASNLPGLPNRFACLATRAFVSFWEGASLVFVPNTSIDNSLYGPKSAMEEIPEFLPSDMEWPLPQHVGSGQQGAAHPMRDNVIHPQDNGTINPSVMHSMHAATARSASHLVLSYAPLQRTAISYQSAHIDTAYVREAFYVARHPEGMLKLPITFLSMGAQPARAIVSYRAVTFGPATESQPQNAIVHEKNYNVTNVNIGEITCVSQDRGNVTAGTLTSFAERSVIFWRRIAEYLSPPITSMPGPALHKTASPSQDSNVQTASTRALVRRTRGCYQLSEPLTLRSDFFWQAIAGYFFTPRMTLRDAQSQLTTISFPKPDIVRACGLLPSIECNASFSELPITLTINNAVEGASMSTYASVRIITDGMKLGNNLKEKNQELAKPASFHAGLANAGNPESTARVHPGRDVKMAQAPQISTTAVCNSECQVRDIARIPISAASMVPLTEGSTPADSVEDNISTTSHSLVSCQQASGVLSDNTLTYVVATDTAASPISGENAAAASASQVALSVTNALAPDTGADSKAAIPCIATADAASSAQGKGYEDAAQDKASLSTTDKTVAAGTIACRTFGSQTMSNATEQETHGRSAVCAVNTIEAKETLQSTSESAGSIAAQAAGTKSAQVTNGLSITYTDTKPAGAVTGAAEDSTSYIRSVSSENAGKVSGDNETTATKTLAPSTRVATENGGCDQVYTTQPQQQPTLASSDIIKSAVTVAADNKQQSNASIAAGNTTKKQSGMLCTQKNSIDDDGEVYYKTKVGDNAASFQRKSITQGLLKKFSRQKRTGAGEDLGDLQATSKIGASNSAVPYSSVHRLIYEARRLNVQDVTQTIENVYCALGEILRGESSNSQNHGILTAAQQRLEQILNELRKSSTDTLPSFTETMLFNTVVSLPQCVSNEQITQDKNGTLSVLLDCVTALSCRIKSLGAARNSSGSASASTQIAPSTHIKNCITSISAVVNACLTIANLKSNKDADRASSASVILKKRAVCMAALAGILSDTQNQDLSTVKRTLLEQVEDAKAIMSERLCSSPSNKKNIAVLELAPLVCDVALATLDASRSCDTENMYRYYLLQATCYVKGLKELRDTEEKHNKFRKRLDNILKKLPKLEASVEELLHAKRAGNERKIKAAKKLTNAVEDIKSLFAKLEAKINKHIMQNTLFAHLAEKAAEAWKCLAEQILSLTLQITQEKPANSSELSGQDGHSPTTPKSHNSTNEDKTSTPTSLSGISTAPFAPGTTHNLSGTMRTL